MESWFPKGLIGELYIGGTGVVRGYVADPRAVGRAIPARSTRCAGSRMYATGDLGRWCEGGVLELLGRRDGQVKVRGFRVELAEVEAAIRSYSGVREAAVVAQEEGADGQRLIACIVADGMHTLHVDGIRQYLRERLPGPMIPSRIRIVESLPRTHSGKVDLQSLAVSLPQEVATTKVHVSPRDELEVQLAAIWEELLQIRPIGVTDDFFDLGGHSLPRGPHGSPDRKAVGNIAGVVRTAPGIDNRGACGSAPRTSPSARASSLIHLGISGPGLPLFLVHPIGGGVFCYNPLTRRLDGISRRPWTPGSRPRRRRRTRGGSHAHGVTVCRRDSGGIPPWSLPSGRMVDGGHRGS